MRKLFLTILVLVGLLGIAYAAEIEDLDTTDASNTARFPENMAPSAVNNGARALEAIVARFHEDLGCRKSSTGSANAYVFDTAQSLSAYYDGLFICFDANFENTDSATVNVETLGAKTIKKNNDQNLASGDIESGQKVLVVYDGTNFQLLSSTAVTSYNTLLTTEGDILIADSGADGVRLAIGSTDGELLRSNATTAVWTDVAASQAVLEAATSVTAYSTPGRQQFHPSAAKFWCVFDGTDADPISCAASFNVVDVTDNATGLYTVNINTDFSSGDWSPSAVSAQPQTNIPAIGVGTVQISTENSNGTDTDATIVSVSGFGDQ